MTDNYGFQDPTQPGMFKAEDWTNHLLLIEPHRYLENIPTKFGPSDAIEARITVLTAQPPHVIEQARLFQTGLVSRLRPALGGLPVLGRLTQELTSGGNAMWVLSESSPEDKAFTHSYLLSRPATQAPAQPQAPAVPVVPPAQSQQAQYPTALPQPPAPPAPAAAPVPQPQPVPQPVPTPTATAAPAAPAGALTPEQIAAMPPEVQRLLIGQQQQQG